LTELWNQYAGTAGVFLLGFAGGFVAAKARR